jgi:hypothetical protein
MKAPIDNGTVPIPVMGTSGATPDLYLEVEPQGQDKSFRLPVHVQNLAAEGVILEVADLPPGVKGETLLQQEGIIHLVPDGLTKETQLRTKVVWVRQGERGPSHYLLGLDLEEADFRARRSLEKLITRPKDMSDLWKYWDQGQTKPAPNDGRIIFYVGAGAFLAGLALKVALPDSHNAMAIILALAGGYVIAGKCLWNWWRRYNISPKS